MLRAVIFDFNGVILDDEPHHYRAMCDAVTGHGIELAHDKYWERYLVRDAAVRYPVAIASGEDRS